VALLGSSGPANSSALTQCLADSEPNNALALLLRRSDLFATRLEEALAIFLKENSPEKLSEQAKKKHFEISEKLEKLITSLEAKSLSIPVAILLSVKEVAQDKPILNIIILMACGLFIITMLVLCLSQMEMFRLVRTEIDRELQSLSNSGLSSSDPTLAKKFPGLHRRLTRAQVFNWIVFALSWIPFLACLYATPTD